MTPVNPVAKDARLLSGDMPGMSFMSAWVFLQDDEAGRGLSRSRGRNTDDDAHGTLAEDLPELLS